VAATETTKLTVDAREPQGSRAVRRLRREGQVPGVLYGGDGDCVTFQVAERVLRQALAHGGAVIELEVEGGKGSPVVVKDEQRHPVNGRLMHIDFLRVRLDQAIEATTIL
jgi:large subunit ribosomal protein L25